MTLIVLKINTTTTAPDNIRYFSATVPPQSPQSLPNSSAVSKLGDAPRPESRGGE